MGVTNDEDPQANDGDAGPAKEIYLFTEEQEPENGDDEIGKSGGGLNVTVIRPGEHEHIGDEKSEQAGDAEPDVAGSEDPKQYVKKPLRIPVACGPDGFHALAEEHIAERGKQNNKEKKNVGFQVQTWRIFHAI